MTLYLQIYLLGLVFLRLNGIEVSAFFFGRFLILPGCRTNYNNKLKKTFTKTQYQIANNKVKPLLTKYTVSFFLARF